MNVFRTVGSAIRFLIGRSVLSLKKSVKKSPLLFFYAKKLYVMYTLSPFRVYMDGYCPYNRRLFFLYVEFCKKSKIFGQLDVGTIDEQDLNTNYLDDKIEKVVLQYYVDHKGLFAQPQAREDTRKIGVLFTELYATGGHTPLVENFIYSISKNYDPHIFCVRKNFILSGHYRNKKENLTDNFPIQGVDWDFSGKALMEIICQYYNQLIGSGCGIFFCYIHPHDVVTVATLALIKKNTNIKIVIINIQDHYYSLGFKFAHLIIDARPAGQHITKNIRGFNNTIILPLQKTSEKETVFYTTEEKNALRKSLGIEPTDFFTLTGTADYKIFDKNQSPYLEMIKDLLTAEPRLKHVLMTELSIDGARSIVDAVFTDKDLSKRLIIIDRVSAYDIYMQACDLFIDSFPQGGAGIHIDMMRNKRPTVLKVHKDMPMRSFEFYVPKDYEYQYAKVEDMKKGILKLLHSPQEQERAIDILYEHWKENYAYAAILAKYETIIKNKDNLKALYS